MICPRSTVDIGNEGIGCHKAWRIASPLSEAEGKEKEADRFSSAQIGGNDDAVSPSTFWIGFNTFPVVQPCSASQQNLRS